MKLEALSEADEAKFAGMFPSEKTLPNARHEPEGLARGHQAAGGGEEFAKRSEFFGNETQSVTSATGRPGNR